MTQDTIEVTTYTNATVGLDLGDNRTEFCVLGFDRKVLERGSVATTRGALAGLFGRFRRTRIALEVCGQSAWISRLAEASGNGVIVADSRRLPLISSSQQKNDRNDAELLARLARADGHLLNPIQHKSEQVQIDRELLTARRVLVASRTQLVNHLRQVVKIFGERIPSCSVECIHKRALKHVPESLRSTLAPVIDVIETLTVQIAAFDKDIVQLSKTRYPQTSLLQRVAGVGDLIALAFVLTIADPGQFRRSRQVGPYLGLVPSRRKSSTIDPQLRITKAGDREMRRLLVISANYILGMGPDCDLRRFGEKLALRGGKNARKRAKVAVARKLGVLMHRLWVTGEVYEPLRQAKLKGEAIPG